MVKLGGIDIVIANAGIGTYGTIENGDSQAWSRTIDVNLTGVFHTVQARLPHVLERRGYVLVIASVASFLPLAGMSSYCASKTAVEALVRTLRAEVGFRGVDAGTAHPSWIDTDMVREVAQDLESFRFVRSKLPWPLRAARPRSIGSTGLPRSRSARPRRAQGLLSSEPQTVVDVHIDGVVPGHGPLTDKSGLREILRYLEVLSLEARRRYDPSTETRSDPARPVLLPLKQASINRAGCR